MLAVVVMTVLCCLAHSTPLPQAPGVTSLAQTTNTSRSKRGSKVLEECVAVGLEEGTYYYKSGAGAGGVCGVYLLATPDQLVQVSLDYLNVDCDTGGLVTFVDGWELGGEVFPSEVDAPLDGRVHELCGRGRKKVYRSTSNAAMVQYRVPRRGDGFRITVRYLRNPRPCHILADDAAGTFTLRNHGRRVNCSLVAVSPATVTLVQVAVGADSQSVLPRPLPALEAGVLTKCSKRGGADYVQLGGAGGLDVGQMQVIDDVCGLDSNPRLPSPHVLCGATVVRLVSSGLARNSVTVALNNIHDLEEVLADDSSLVCGLQE